MKFGRKYSLSVEVAGTQNLTITDPFSITFSIERNSLASSNTANFRIHNLGEQTRNLIYFDRFNITQLRGIQFRAGYEEFTPLVFNGTIREAQSYRTGVDMITEISCYDGGFGMANAFTSAAYAAGKSASEFIKDLSKNLLGGTPIVGNFPAINKRGEVIFGSTWQAIQYKSDGLAYIDNGQVRALQENEAFEGVVGEINSDTGLLGSPRRGEAMIEIEMLFEPRLSVGQVLELNSSTNRIFNGRYKVMGFSHRGTISPAVSGETRTTATLWLGTQPLQILKGAAPLQ